MSAGSISQEYRDAISTVFKSLSARVMKHHKNWDFSWGESQFTNLQAKLAAMIGDLGNATFILELTQKDDSGGQEFTAAAICKANETKTTIMLLGKSLRIIGNRKLVATLRTSPGAAEIGEASQGTVLISVEGGNFVTVYACERIVDQFELSTPHLSPPTTSRFSRRAEEYESSILDHYKHCVRLCESTDHWADRGKRKLRARLGAAHKTELIFHHNLHQWLKLNLDAQVWSSPKDTTKNELDLIIQSQTGPSYLIELKWMGTNESGTTYKITTVSKGLKQLDVYLKTQPRVKKGTLVAYDARAKEEFDSLLCSNGTLPDGCKKLSICGDVDVPVRGSCLILFLESNTASNQ